MAGREAGAPGEDEPRFRVRVCMRRFFADERARCLLLVSPRRRVRWLARRLRALFPLPPRAALLCDGHLLPRDEPLALLRADDLVEVVPRRAGPERGGVADAPEDTEGDFVDSRADGTDEAFGARADVEDEDAVGVEVEDGVGDCDSETADVLHDSKRRALAALERYCGSIGAERAAAPAPPRARRRRVRRRRRPTAPQVPEPSGRPCDGPSDEPNDEQSDEPRDDGPSAGRPRAPRVVHALPEAALVSIFGQRVPGDMR